MSRPPESTETNLSDVAYQFGVPDGTLALASFALTVPLAAAGGRDRPSWLALATAGKAVVDALAAGEYFWQMLSGKQKWCSYCITGAAASFGILALALPDAWGVLIHEPAGGVPLPAECPGKHGELRSPWDSLIGFVYEARA
jgi:hypothetical protein